MSRLRDYNLDEKISSIKSTLEELGRGSLGSLDSSRNPSLLRRLDSASSFNSEQSIDQFLSQQREQDSRRVEDRLPDVPEKTMDYSYNEEDRPLATQKWESTLSKTFRKSANSESLSELIHIPSGTIPVSDRSKDEIISNMNRLQSELYLRLEDCQRQLELARQSSMEQETQAQLRIEELSAALEATRTEQSRHERYGESLAGRLKNLENLLEEANKQTLVWQERNQSAEDNARDMEKRTKNAENDLIRTTEQLRIALRDKENLLSELKITKETNIRLESTLKTSNFDGIDRETNLISLQNRLQTSEKLISDLRDENQGLVKALERRSIDLNRLQEEKKLLEQRYSDTKSNLKQQETVSKTEFELRIREVEEELTATWKHKVRELESKLTELRSEKENMELELESRPSNKRVRELECQVERLEERLVQEAGKRHRNASMSVTPTRFRRTPLGEVDRNRTEVGRKKGEMKGNTLKLVMQELKESSPEEVVSKVRELVQGRKDANAAVRLLGKLRQLVRECSPETGEEPTPKKVWHWVRTITEDLMRLRTEQSWDQVMTALGVVSSKAVYPKVSSLLTDLERLKSVLAKAKAALNLSDQASMDDLEAVLSKRD